jgi:hypothetical protein
MNTTNTFSPQFVQPARLATPGSQHQVNFTNISSQQLNPGSLVQFMNNQSAHMRPMPFTNGDIHTDRSGVARQVNERHNVSNLPQVDTLPEFFHAQDPITKDAKFVTPEQRVWRVPDYLLEARATELF